MRGASTGLAAILAALALGASFSHAALVEHWWQVTYVDNVNPDGLMPRRVIGVNGTWPLPIININSSDTLRIHVTNALDDGVGTALHSHGMYFNNTNYYDGATGITQCPIPYGQSYTYEILNSPKSPNGTKPQWGTFWSHGHYQGQYVDGLKTPSIIHADRPAIQAHAYDDDYTVVLTDWYHDEYAKQMTYFLDDVNPTGAEPIPDAGLMYFAHTPNVTGQAQYLSGGYNENATLPFEPGKTYRLRLINMSSLAMFHFWIDGHDIRIIEVDGVDVEEHQVDAISISVAQRYSVLVTARNDTTQNWKIHAHQDPDMYDTVPDTLQLNVTSTLQYNSSANAEFGPEETREYEMFDERVLTPSYPEAIGPAAVTKDMNVWFDTRSNGANYAAFNNISFVFPQTPTINSMMSLGALSLDPVVYGPDANAFLYSHMDVIDVTIYNWDAGFHPFHLHGHNFAVVHKSLDSLSDDPELNPPYDPSVALENPIRRDTVAVPSGGSATIRFVADNPGAW